MDMKMWSQKFDFLREPARKVTEAYEKGTRWFDSMKEIVLIEHGLRSTSEMIHETAHWFPGQFDMVGDILHQRHIVQDYGSTPQYVGTAENMGDIFAQCVAVFDEISTALADMIRVCDENGTGSYAIARQLENLQIALSKEHEKYLMAWDMWEKADSPTSYDSWIKNLLHDSEGDA